MSTDRELIKEIWQVLPDDFKNRAMSMRDLIARVQWTLGDLCNEAYQYVRANKIEARKIHCAALIAVMIDDGNHTANTIMVYSQVASKFPASLDGSGPRERYRDFPFSLFMVAKSMGNNWQVALELASELTSRTGRPPTKAALEQALNGCPQTPDDRDPNDSESDEELQASFGALGLEGFDTSGVIGSPGDLVPGETLDIGGLVKEVYNLSLALEGRANSLGHVSDGEIKALAARIAIQSKQIADILFESVRRPE